MRNGILPDHTPEVVADSAPYAVLSAPKTIHTQNSMSYEEKKAHFANMLTIYGRKAVEEALMSNDINAYKLHLADSNKPATILKHCEQLANDKGTPIAWHDKRALSFISKNAKQDQGIALDISMDNFFTLDDLQSRKAKHLIMLDNVTNPQNVGMIIRSVAAGFVDGLIIPKKGCAELGPLAIKASVGALFKAPIYRCETSKQAVETLKGDYQLINLSLDTDIDFYDCPLDKPSIFILGNESEGVSRVVANACGMQVKIPMNNAVESLNVAITSALIAYHPALRR
ncbi:Putative TrmH family tRNA/rRNA methyltransferase [BD1-7 clade bacterium]|uniref:TrmH family tRNA/rRNA methyltransferase n=1 Tax=BD1-7 clade bacterium TaxID=2029982 RepID=A0A5S9QLK6_9GAMM|nr:Putative TrmH family tRNA/rRNA methyltransferase [BD1-7 clade bacterium]